MYIHKPPSSTWDPFYSFLFGSPARLVFFCSYSQYTHFGSPASLAWVWAVTGDSSAPVTHWGPLKAWLAQAFSCSYSFDAVCTAFSMILSTSSFPLTSLCLAILTSVSFIAVLTPTSNPPIASFTTSSTCPMTISRALVVWWVWTIFSMHKAIACILVIISFSCEDSCSSADVNVFIP